LKRSVEPVPASRGPRGPQDKDDDPPDRRPHGSPPAQGRLRPHVAYGFVKALRFCADTFFAKRYGHRAVVLETVAAVPGMVGAT
jgi:hypothetical protein